MRLLLLNDPSMVPRCSGGLGKLVAGEKQGGIRRTSHRTASGVRRSAEQDLASSVVEHEVPWLVVLIQVDEQPTLSDGTCTVGARRAAAETPPHAGIPSPEAGRLAVAISFDSRKLPLVWNADAASRPASSTGGELRHRQRRRPQRCAALPRPRRALL